MAAKSGPEASSSRGPWRTHRATTNSHGIAIFDNLKSAIRYRLTETAAPDGFIPMEEYIYLTINEDGSVTVEDSYFAEAGNSAYNIIVKNSESVPLPESGGEGSGMLYVLGTLLCLGAIGIYIDTLRKRGCRD